MLTTAIADNPTDSGRYVAIDGHRFEEDSLVIFEEGDVSEYDAEWYIAFADKITDKHGNVRFTNNTDTNPMLDDEKRDELPTSHKHIERPKLPERAQPYVTTYDEYTSSDTPSFDTTFDVSEKAVQAARKAARENVDALWPPSPKGERETLDTLDDVQDIIKERDGSGDPHVIHAHIADVWSAYLGVNIEPYHVATMMAQLKMVRQEHGDADRDDGLDAVGYTAIAVSMNESTNGGDEDD